MEPIVLTPYHPQWKEIFLQEQECLGQVLGPVAVSIHHVGSTAVPDLLAKPIIDIAVEARTFPPSPSMLERLLSAGYQSRGEANLPGRHWFIKGVPRRFHLHYCLVGSEIVRRQLAFRNRLRRDVSLRRAYEQVKLQNSLSRDIDSTEYAQSKTDLIREALYRY